MITKLSVKRGGMPEKGERIHQGIVVVDNRGSLIPVRESTKF
jgi:hypothetical protein